MGEPRISSRLRRLRGEPTSDDPVSQSYGFIRQCLEEGIEDNEIVIMAREHKPTMNASTQRSSTEGSST